MGFNAAGQEIADGEFLVLAATSGMSTADLLRLLDNVNKGNLKAKGYPTVIDETVVLHTGTVDDEVRRRDRPKLQEVVTQQLSEVAAITGVRSISCNQVAHPSLAR